MKHTPLPWKRSGNSLYSNKQRLALMACTYCSDTWSEEEIQAIMGEGVPALEARANVGFIVQACNSHYELVEALEELVAEFDVKNNKRMGQDSPYYVPDTGGIVLARQALKKAKGK